MHGTYNVTLSQNLSISRINISRFSARDIRIRRIKTNDYLGSRKKKKILKKDFVFVPRSKYSVRRSKSGWM